MIMEANEYILAIYADNVESPDEKDTRSKKARELLQYLGNNREGLLPYDRQGVEIPEPPGEQRSDTDNRAIYRRADLHDADEAGDRDLERRQGTKEGWEGKYLRRPEQPAYALTRCHADGIQKGAIIEIVFYAMERANEI